MASWRLIASVSRPRCESRPIRSIRRPGYALNDEEVEVGLRVIAVPVRDTGGSVIASMCVSTYSSRYEVGQLTEKFLQPLLNASERLQQLL